MSKTCCCCIPLYYGVAIIGAFNMFSLINVALQAPALKEKTAITITVVAQLALCIAFANALLFDSNIKGRKYLLICFAL